MGGERKRGRDHGKEGGRVIRECLEEEGNIYTDETSKPILVAHEFHILHARVTPSLVPCPLVSPDPAQPLFHSLLPSSSAPQSSGQLAGWSSPSE